MFLKHWTPTAIMISAILGTAASWGQSDRKSEDPGGLPLKTTRTIEFTTEEGTWMSVDVSPDGHQIVFDLLGDLYTMPITGGQTRRITSGPAWDTQPRFSPDGKWIAFVSDRNGADHQVLVERLAVFVAALRRD